MILNTKLFKEAADTILLAIGVDKTVTNLELAAGNGALFLNVTNSEYYVSIKQTIENQDTFKAVVDATTFLSLISSISTDEFELTIVDNKIVIKSGKSKYSIPLIYKNDKLLEVPVIRVDEAAVEMQIPLAILQSILNINGKEIAKIKKLDTDELQRLYFVDETGCFTFNSGACINSFTLAKPVKMLLNDRIVKLFKLFDADVEFKLGYETTQADRKLTKIAMTANNVYMAAIIPSDDILLNRMAQPYETAKKFLTLDYKYNVEISTTDLETVINRIAQFTKNSVEKANMSWINILVTIKDNEVTIKDTFNNIEVFNTINNTATSESYEFPVNLPDLKAVVDSCKNEKLSLFFGNYKNILITRDNIFNIIPERRIR